MSPEISAANYLHAAVVSLVLGISYVVVRVIFNLYFHPLAKFPGPWYAAMSNTWYAFAWTGGRYPFIINDLHRKYGSVIRIAPNDLDFATTQSIQDIYGHTKQGEARFLKGDFYKSSPEVIQGVVSELDPVKHRELRKRFSHAFSTKELKLQADAVLQYVDLWIQKTIELGNTDGGINATQWYSCLTLDIIGDLAFGEPFGATETTKGSPLLDAIGTAIRAGSHIDVFRRVPLLKLFPRLIRPKGILKVRSQLFKDSREKMLRRMAKADRHDFFSQILAKKADSSLVHTPEFLAAQANVFIIAGSETTATSLLGVTWFLLNNPSTLQRLTEEVRAAFSSSLEIDADSTQSLPYLFSVIEEGLRLYPPVPAGLHRVSPGAIVDGHFVPKGTVVSAAAWAICHDEHNFHDAKGWHPERWLPETHELYDPIYRDDVKKASQPFSVGPRACLGINMAYLEMRLILSKIVWHFDIELLSTNVDWEADNIMRGLWVKPDLFVRYKPVVR